MGKDVKEENNAPRLPAAAEAGGNNNNNNRRGGGCRGAHNRWNNPTSGTSPTHADKNKFKSRNKDIPEDVVLTTLVLMTLRLFSMLSKAWRTTYTLLTVRTWVMPFVR
jgi:hypothetical protein